jgi:tetratricopeptide (TPR) repeat protein
VVTAAQFVADLYAALTEGLPLGAAVTRGRKQLHAQPLREVVAEARELQDWPVPVVYEAIPIPLFPPRRTDGGLHISIGAAEATPARGALDEALPAAPDAGFWGRDETLLNLDRAFDTHPVVLLHAFAGSGKTTTAAEFARWYSLTGGVDGPVLFTSFEQYRPLARVLDSFGALFGPALERSGVHWLTLDDEDRRDVALQVMRQVPVLWIWDNVEPVRGFPAGTPSAWSAAEQRELVDFLRDARGTRARFLLTSRRDEQAWLGDLPARVTLPPMPLTERQQLARALVAKHGRRWEGATWQPLLRYSAGNPLTLTVVVSQALRDRLTTKEAIEAYVARLRAGEQAFDDDVTQGRSRSLGASLSYGFANTFTADEQRILALLHFFQGFVSVDALTLMGHPDAGWCLDSVRGLTREAGMALLDRAAEIGLLTALGGGYYFIHPALPWFFKRLFDQHYPAAPLDADNPQSAIRDPQLDAARAFVEAMGVLGDYYQNEYERGNRDVIAILRAEEANLLHARQVALAHGWWRRVTSTMQGLRTLYDHTGRRAEWSRLVAEIMPAFVDPATDGPLPGREEDWGLVNDYRVRLAQEAHNWVAAERLQQARVEWTRQRAAPALAAPPAALDGAGRNAIRTLGVALHELGQIQLAQEKPECIENLKETARLDNLIGDRPAEAVAAFNLGHAYKDLLTVRDLAQAEHWYRRSLDLREERDRLGRGRCLGQLGYVAWERFKEARWAGQPDAARRDHLNTAAGFYQQALALLPPDAVADLAVSHNQLGNIYDGAGDLDRALRHYQEAIRYDEVQGNLYGAAQTRNNVALALRGAGRLPDALLYAQAALRNWETYGDAAAADIQDARRLITRIEQAMHDGPAAQPGGGVQ